jgi:hypothetical protein
MITQIALLKDNLEIMRNPATTILISKYDWTKFRRGLGHRGVVFHPREWVQSLDDTPEIFRDRKVQLRSEVGKYLERKKGDNANTEVLRRTWSKQTAYELVPVADLLYFSLFDINLSIDDTFSIKRSAGRSTPPSTWYTKGNQSKLRWSAADKSERSKRTDTDNGPSLWSRYLDGRASEHPDFKNLHEEGQRLLADKDIRDQIFKQFHTELLEILTDSVKCSNTKKDSCPLLTDLTSDG